MSIDDLEACCEHPSIGLEETREPSYSPIIAPVWNVRIVCRNCGARSIWATDFNTAALFWNKIHRKEKTNNESD